MAFGGGAPFDAFRQGFGDAAALVVLVDVEAVEVLPSRLANPTIRPFCTATHVSSLVKRLRQRERSGSFGAQASDCSASNP